MTNLFRTDNTEGYTQMELDELNSEWTDRGDEMELEEFTPVYDIAADEFSNEVARR